MAAELKLFQPHKYYSVFMDRAIRPDGRQLSKFGPTAITIGCLKNANGSALVNLRGTAVICGVKAELANPRPESPGEGYIVPNVDFPPICASIFMPGPPPALAQMYSQLLVELIQNSSFIDPKDLCIVEGKLCWCLYIDISCLNYCGNVLDAIVLAMVSAAANTYLPEVSVGDTVEVQDNTTPLRVSEMPFSSTFAIFDKDIVADPTTEEEYLSFGTVSVFIKEGGRLCNVFMQGGCTADESTLKKCIKHSKKRWKKLASLLRHLLQKEDELSS